MSVEAALEFKIEIAGHEDDAAIRRLLATNPIPGTISMTFEREPNYFLGCGVAGQFCQVLIARQQPEGTVVGVGCRSLRYLFINGLPEPVGYLSQLRVDRRAQGRGLVARGFALLRQLHSDRQAAIYLASITEENVQARGLLVERACHGIPVFREYCRLITLALVVRRPTPPPRAPYAVRRGSPDQLSAIVAFLQTYGAARQFFPLYTEADFCDNPTTGGFVISDFVVAYRGDRIVAVMGLWDQSSYKQTIVHAYRGMLHWGQPLYNTAARFIGAQPLPKTGQPIRSAYASFICVAPSEHDSFPTLLHHIYNLAAERRYAYLMIGLASSDPLLPLAQRYLHIAYRSRLYIVHWDDGADMYAKLDQRVPYIEIATL